MTLNSRNFYNDHLHKGDGSKSLVNMETMDFLDISSVNKSENNNNNDIGIMINIVLMMSVMALCTKFPTTHKTDLKFFKKQNNCFDVFIGI